MTNAQALVELLRQQKELQRAHDQAPLKVLKTQLRPVIDSFPNWLSGIREIAEKAPDAETTVDVRESITRMTRTLEAAKSVLSKTFAMLHSAKTVANDDLPLIMVHIQLPGLDLGKNGFMIGQIIQRSIDHALRRENLLPEPAEFNGGIGMGDSFSLAFRPSDQQKAIAVIQTELDQISLLPYCHIAHLAARAKVDHGLSDWAADAF